MVDDNNFRQEWEFTELERKLYWKSKLKNIEKENYITCDYKDVNSKNSHMKVLEESFPNQLIEQIKKITRGKSESKMIFHIAVLSTFLYKFTGSREALVWSKEEKKYQRFMIHRISTEGSMRFKDLLSQTYRVVKSNLKIQGLTYQEMSNIIRSQNTKKVFDKAHIMLNSVQSLENDELIPMCGMYFDFSMGGNHSDFLLYYNSGLYNKGTAKIVMHNYMNTLNCILNNVEQTLEEVTLLSPKDLQKLLNGWERKKLGYPVNQSLPELFQNQAITTPNCVAVKTLSGQITYQELDVKSSRIARYLCNNTNVGQSPFIAVFMERSLEFVISMLAIMKSGKAYLPVQPSYPWERIRYMLDDSNVTTMFITEEILWQFKDKLDQCNQISNILCMDEETELMVRDANIIGPSGMMCSTGKLPNVRAEDLAYLIYTSGTAGNPKGVMIRHKSAINHIYAEFDDLNIPAAFTFLQSAPSSSDISVWQFFAPLCLGGITAIIERQDILNMARLFQYIKETGVNVIEFVPQLLREFLQYIRESSKQDELVGSLKYIIATGETIPVDLVNLSLDTIPGIKIINAYGPTEAADDVVQKVFTQKLEDNLLRLSIGHPLNNIKVYILDEKKNLVPFGVQGEIYISGIALSTGYWGDEKKTAERFIQNPFEHGSLMYRTGDMGAWRLDGTIDYFGRNDYQVKINGFRIELDEIDSILMKCDKVRQSISVVKASKQREHKSIATYIEATQKDCMNEIKEFIDQNIPQYMKPAKLILLDRIPINQAGKFDRNYLESRKDELQEDKKIQALKVKTIDIKNMDITKNLLDIWRTVFKNEQIDIYDNFFDLGGDSIISIQLCARAEQKGIIITPKDIFNALTIAEIVMNNKLQNKSDAEENRTAIHGKIPLSPIQKWFFSQHYEIPEHFNQAILLDVDSQITPDMIEDVLYEIVNHHDMLRAYFVIEQGSIIQKCLEYVESIALIVQDIVPYNEKTRKNTIKKVSEKYQKDIRLDHPLLERFVLFRGEENDKQQLLIIIHHLIVDWVSWRIIAEDLNLAFQQKLQKTEICLPKKTISYQAWYQDIANQWNTDFVTKVKEQWNQNIEEVEKSKNLLRCERGLLKSTDFEINERITKKLDHIAHIYNVNLQEMILSVLTEVLHDFFGVNVVQIDLESLGRESALTNGNITRTVGWFTALTPILLEYQKQEDICIRAAKLRKQIKDKDAVAFSMFRFGKKELYIDDLMSESLNSSIRFNYMGQLDLALPFNSYFSVSSDTIAASYSEKNLSSYYLDINTGRNQGKLYFNLLYNTNGMSEKKADELKEKFLFYLNDISKKYCRNYSIFSFGTLLSEADIDNCVHEQSDIADIFPMTSMQQAIMTHNIMFSRQEYSKQTIKSTIHGKLDPDAFVKAWKDVIKMHPILRTSFVWRHVPVPLQVVHKNAVFDFQLVDLSNLGEDQQKEAIVAMEEKEKKIHFDITKCPLIRFRLLKVKGQCYEFYVYYSASLFDNWSWNIVVKDFFYRYKEYIEGKAKQDVSEKSLVDYVRYIMRNNTKRCAMFWEHELSGFHNVSIQKKKVDAVKFIPQSEYGWLNEKITKMILVFCKNNNITINTILQCAWAITFCHMTKTNDVVYGILSSGRPSSVKNIDAIAGPLSNLIPVRFLIKEDEDIISCLNQVQKKQISTISYDFVSVQQIASYVHVKPEEIQKIIY